MKLYNDDVCIVRKETLDELVSNGILTRDSKNNIYTFETPHGYITKNIRPNDAFFLEHSGKPDSFKSDATVENFVEQAEDLLAYVSFYKDLIDILQNQGISEELDAKMEKMITEHHVLKLTLMRIAHEYENYVTLGFPIWEHTKMAKRFGISVKTLKTYLKEMGLYDETKHHNPHTLK